MNNPCQEMTSYQEAMQELRDNVAAMREQIAEAYAIITSDRDAKGMTMRIVEWLDQNESIAKGAVK